MAPGGCEDEAFPSLSLLSLSEVSSLVDTWFGRSRAANYTGDYYVKRKVSWFK